MILEQNKILQLANNILIRHNGLTNLINVPIISPWNRISALWLFLSVLFSALHTRKAPGSQAHACSYFTSVTQHQLGS